MMIVYDPVEIFRDKSWSAGYTDYFCGMRWRPDYWRSELGHLYDGLYWMGWEDGRFETDYRNQERLAN